MNFWEESVLVKICIQNYLNKTNLQTEGSNPHLVKQRVSKYCQTISVNFSGPQTNRKIMYTLKVVFMLVNQKMEQFEPPGTLFFFSQQ